MTAPQAVGTPAVSSPAPSVTDAGSEPTTPEAVTGPSDEGDDGDEVAVARRKAREILFSETGEPEPEKPKQAEKKPEEKPKDETDLSRGFAKLHAQEKRLDAKRAEFTQQQEAFKRQSEEFQAKAKDIELAYSDPVQFLAKAGWSKDQIIKWIQSDGKVEPEILIKQLSDKHQQEMEALRKEREREREELEGTRRQRELERVDSELSAEVRTLYSSDAELSLLNQLAQKSPKQAKLIDSRVKQIISEVWKKSQQAVDPRDALLYLQQELTELQLGPGQAPVVTSTNPAAVEPRPITNSATSQRTVRPTQYDESDPEARRARAAAILAGEIEE